MHFVRMLIIALTTVHFLQGEHLPVSSQTTIYLIRHGETDGNLNGIVQGSIDIPLNNTGIQQAKEAKQELEGVAFDAAYSSDLTRAKVTAAIVLEGRRINIINDPRLRERNFGAWEGKSFDDYYAVTHEERSKETEPTEQLIGRAMSALQEITDTHPGQTIFVASHGNLIKNVIAPIMGIPDTDLKIGNLAYAKLIYKDGVVTIADTHRVTITIGNKS